ALTTVLATFNDPDPANGVPDNPYTASVNWGDSSSDNATVLKSGPDYTVQGNHTYQEEGQYLITASVKLMGQTVLTIYTTATVSDPPLVVTPGALSGMGGQMVGGTVASFTDPHPDTVTSYSALIEWGDNSLVSTGLVQF